MGDVVPLFGVSNGAAKNRNKKIHRGLRRPAATEGTMKGRHDEREARGKHDTIVFGRHYS